MAKPLVLDRYTLGVVGRIMDQGTDSDGWDVGIMEELWELVASAKPSLIARCPHCDLEYCTASNDGECPFEFCEPEYDPERDDFDDEVDTPTDYEGDRYT